MSDSVLDLRQYTLKPGRRDELIDIFDTHFVTGQEATGMHVVGQFRDLDDPDRFVWLRAFDSYEARGAALPAFYTGPVWRAHGPAANDTMLDSDDALLLRPLLLGPGYPGSAPHPSAGADSLVSITVAYRDRPIDAPFERLVLDRIVPQLRAAGAEPVAVLATLAAANNFPALPLRDEQVVAWVLRFGEDEAYARFRVELADAPGWRDEVLPELRATTRLQRLRLRPSAGSRLR